MKASILPGEDNNERRLVGNNTPQSRNNVSNQELDGTLAFIAAA
jgi:hypothetical protein